MGNLIVTSLQALSLTACHINTAVTHIVYKAVFNSVVMSAAVGSILGVAGNHAVVVTNSYCIHAYVVKLTAINHTAFTVVQGNTVACCARKAYTGNNNSLCIVYCYKRRIHGGKGYVLKVTILRVQIKHIITAEAVNVILALSVHFAQKVNSFNL